MKSMPAVQQWTTVPEEVVKYEIKPYTKRFIAL